MRRATKWVACIAAASTLGMGMMLPTSASAFDAETASPTAVTQSAEPSPSNEDIAAIDATGQPSSDGGAAATAEETATPLAFFDFDADPVDGAFTDRNTGAKAVVHGNADLPEHDAEHGHAAHTGANFWMNATKDDGTALLAGLNDVTISYDSKANATGGAWTVFAAPGEGQVDGNAPTYLGVLDQTNKTRVERYLNGRGGDAATIDLNVGTKDAWKHVDLVISGTTAKLYVDRRFVASNVNGRTLAEILGGSGGVLQIGKGNWGDGEYFTGLIDDLAVYGTALSATQLGVEAPERIDVTGGKVRDGRVSLKEGTSTTLTASVTPEGAEPEVIWTSSAPNVVTVDDAGTITGVDAGTATVTAASTADPNVTAVVDVTVAAVGDDDAYGYAMVHFVENSAGYAEKIYLDITRGDNAEQWDTLNGGEPILASNESTTGVRDPFIAYDPESKTYYILATDLRVFGGDNAQWGAWSTDYSTKLHVWKSKDLIHFDEMTELETATADSYSDHPAKTQTLTDTVTGNTLSEIGMAWAPEATWVPNFYDLNDDGELNGSDVDNPENQRGGAFVMYWSTSATYDGENHQPGRKVTHVLWAATKDFTNATYTFGGVFVPNSKYRAGNTIDTTLLQHDGRTYRTTGSGTIFMEYTDRADWWRANDQGQYAEDPATGWVLGQNNIGHTLGSAQEGANGFKVNGEDRWYMFVDNYGSVASGARYGYNMLVADDLDAADGNVWSVLESDDFHLTANTKHGGIVPLTKAQYDAIRAADALAKDNQGLTVQGVTVANGATAADVVAALPKTRTVTLANGQGTAERAVTWQVDDIDTTTAGVHTVTGIVDTIGANLNHWSWTAADGTVKTDLDDLGNASGANNAWKQSGGFTDNETARANRPLYSDTAITVTAEVTVEDEVEPIDPDLLADFTFDDGDRIFDGGNALGVTQGRATLVTSQEIDGAAAKLSGSFWLNVTAKDGTPLLKGRDALTISYDSKPEAGKANTGWAFFAASDATTQEYGEEHYIGVMDKTDSLTVERYANDTKGHRDSSGNLGDKRHREGWKHVDIVIDGATAKLYVDGKLAAYNTTGKTVGEILGTEGGILQIGKANWASGEYYAGLLDNLTIWGRALSDEELGVEGAKTDYAAALAIPARISGDLPSSVLGRTVTWSASGEGAALVAADGKVTRPASDEPSVKVTLTAAIDGVDEPVTAQATILDDGGRIATYVKDVDRSDPNGAKYDPVAYDDDRRADSLYVSAKAAGETDWEQLNRSQAILSVKWDGSQSANPNAQMGSPALFRDKDGRLGLVAAQNNATGGVYVWTARDDGATFTDQRAITVTDTSIVRDARIVYDAAAQGYKVFWTDALSGEGRTATLSDLTAKAEAGETCRADAVAMGASDPATLPAWAGEGQTGEFAMSADEFAAFADHYRDLRNTGVEDIAQVDVANGADAADVASAVAGRKAVMTYNDGSTKTFSVDWNADDLAAVDTAKAGAYEVKGTVRQVDEGMYNDARADPDIFYNEDDGYYYLTGSTYEVASTDPTNSQATSYRSIGLKRSKTISGLKSAEEHIIIRPEDGTPGHMDEYPDSFYGWSAFIWAQEFHKINGRWWIVAGFHKGASTKAGGWCNNTILIPYTGDAQSIRDGGMLKAENWGEPTVLEGAAFDVTYFEREEDGVTQGYWLQPKNANLYVAKARMGEGETPLAASDFKQVYAISQVFDYGKSMPTPSDASEGTDQGVVEAPFMFEHGDYVYIAYAGGTVDKYYTTNLLRAAKDADLQDASSWTQVDFPVLQTADTYTGEYGADETSYERRHAGPGHISLVHDEDGNIVVAYHARPYPEIHTDANLAGGLMDQDRNTWVKSVNVRANGMLDFSLTKDEEVAPEHRTVSVKVVVAADETPTPDPNPEPDPDPKPDPDPDPEPGPVDPDQPTDPDQPGEGDDGASDGKGDGVSDGGASGKPIRRPVLSRTGAAVLGVGGAMGALALAGISLTLWRRRRA